MPRKTQYWICRGRGLCVNCGMRSWEGTARCGPCQRRHHAKRNRPGHAYTGHKQDRDGMERAMRKRHPGWTHEEVQCAVNREWRKRKEKYGEVGETAAISRKDFLRRRGQMAVYGKGASA